MQILHTERSVLHTTTGRKANWRCQNLAWELPTLKNVIEGKIEGKAKGKRWGGRRSK